MGEQNKSDVENSAESFESDDGKTEYWEKRDNIYKPEYESVDRLEIVHIDPDNLDDAYPTDKQQSIIRKAKELEKRGVRVVFIHNFTTDKLRKVNGKKIVVGGLLTDMCVGARADILKEKGATAIIDLALSYDNV